MTSDGRKLSNSSVAQTHAPTRTAGRVREKKPRQPKTAD